MTDLFNDILNHLKNDPVNSDVDITNLIRQATYIKYNTTDGTITILKILNHLKSKNFVITIVTNSDGQINPLDEKGQDFIRRNPRITFENLNATAHITNDGKDYLELRERNTLGFWGEHPFYEKLAIVLISGAISLMVGLTISKQSKQSQSLIDKQQDSLSNGLADSVKNIQMRLDTLK